jgi:hypothetical protein
LDIQYYIDRNPSSHETVKRSEIDFVNKRLLFYLGVELPYSVRNFLSICNGVDFGGVFIYSASSILEMTLVNEFLNQEGESKSLEVGRSSDSYMVYNYEEDAFDVLAIGGGVSISFGDLFSLFDYYSDLSYDTDSYEEKTYEQLILDQLEAM